MRSRLKIPVIIISVITYFLPAESQVLQMDSALKRFINDAMNSNPSLETMQKRIDAAKMKIPRAGAWADPRLSVGLMNLPVNSFDLNQEPMTGIWVTASQRIPLTGKMRALTEIAEYETFDAVLKLNEARLSIAEQIAKAWYELAFLSESRQLVKVEIKIIDDLTETTKTQYETGMGSQQDIFNTTIRRSRLTDRLIQLDQEILTTRRQLAVLKGMNPDSTLFGSFTLADTFPKLDPDELNDAIFENNPHWLEINNRSAILHKSIEIAQMNRIPDLNLSAAYGFRQDQSGVAERPDFFSVSAAVSLPVFLDRKQNQTISERTALLNATRHERRSLELNLLLRLRKLVDIDQRIEDQIQLSTQMLEPEATEMFQSAVASYVAGKADFEAVLRAESILLLTKSDRLFLLKERHLNRISLTALTGDI